MFHSVREPGGMLQDGVTVSTEVLQYTVDTARRLGFETITSRELLSFLTHNAPIPRRSMIWIVDDRYPGALEKYLLPHAEANDWTITLGWIIGDTGPALWKTMERLAGGGRLDVQSHGFQHRYISDGFTEDEIRTEVAASIPILESHFGYRPIAFVWPGGSFTAASVAIAREEGYQLGFTAYSRGPILFNWVPQGPEEQTIEDPVMLLPRAWSPSAVINLEQAARIGEAAAAEAADARPAEQAWYRANCGGDLPSP